MTLRYRTIAEQFEPAGMIPAERFERRPAEIPRLRGDAARAGRDGAPRGPLLRDPRRRHGRDPLSRRVRAARALPAPLAHGGAELGADRDRGARRRGAPSGRARRARGRRRRPAPSLQHHHRGQCPDAADDPPADRGAALRGDGGGPRRGPPRGQQPRPAGGGLARPVPRGRGGPRRARGLVALHRRGARHRRRSLRARPRRAGGPRDPSPPRRAGGGAAPGDRPADRGGGARGRGPPLRPRAFQSGSRGGGTCSTRSPAAR